MSLTKPILLALVGILSVVLFLQVGNIVTGMAVSEQIPSNATIQNAAPVVDSVTLTMGTPTACSTTNTLECKANIHDQNGYTDINNATYKAVIYHSSTSESCSPNYNDCYIFTTECTDTAAAGDYRNVTCTANVLRYYAKNGTWTCKFYVNDTSNQQASNTDTDTLNAYTALDVLSSVIEFGQVPVDTQSSVQTIGVQNCGNYQMDINLTGTDMTCSSGCGTITTIGVGNITYNNVNNNATATALTTSEARINNFNLNKATSDAGNSNNTYWWLYAPHGTRGVYTGTVTFGAVLD